MPGAHYGEIPVYPAYWMAQAVYGMNPAHDRAIGTNNGVFFHMY